MSLETIGECEFNIPAESGARGETAFLPLGAQLDRTLALVCPDLYSNLAGLASRLSYPAA